MSTVESLPAKWRETALAQDKEAEVEGNTEAERDWHMARAQQADECADELEAALASQPKDGELLALADEMQEAADDFRGLQPVDALDEWVAILRTLASRRVVNVDTVLNHLRQRGYECADKRTFQDDLAAALQPSGEVG